MTTNKIYYSPELPPHVFGAAAAAWVHNTAYLAGVLVTNGGHTYFCLVGHTSTNDDEGFAPDLAAGNWLLVTASAWTVATDVASVAAGAGHISAVWDRGAGDKPMDYIWRASTRWVDTAVAGYAWSISLASSHGAASPGLTDGFFTFGDAGLAAAILGNVRANARFIGQVGAIAVAQRFVKSGYCSIFHRYNACIGWNHGVTKAMHLAEAQGGTHWVMFQPVPTAIQASA
jgi:hypothetical protein